MASAKLDLYLANNFWMYVTTPSLWHVLRLSGYINSPQKSDLQKYDVVNIYVKSKKVNNIGFVRAVQVGDPVTNKKVFGDQNLNKYGYQVLACYDVDYVRLSELNIGKVQKFSAQYLHSESIFVKMNFDMGQRVAQFINDRQEPDNKSAEESESDNEAPEKESDNESEEPIQEKNEAVEQNANIPILIVPCQDLYQSLVEEEPNLSNIINDHITNCEECDITDNNNKRMFQLLKNWYDSEFVYSEVDTSDENCKLALQHYDNLTAYELEKPGINAIFIVEEGHLYNECLLLYWY